MINYFMKTFDFESDPNFEMVLNYAFLIEPVDKLRINLKLKENPLIYQWDICKNIKIIANMQQQ